MLVFSISEFASACKDKQEVQSANSISKTLTGRSLSKTWDNLEFFHEIENHIVYSKSTNLTWRLPIFTFDLDLSPFPHIQSMWIILIKQLIYLFFFCSESTNCTEEPTKMCYSSLRDWSVICVEIAFSVGFYMRSLAFLGTIANGKYTGSWTNQR